MTTHSVLFPWYKIAKLFARTSLIFAFLFTSITPNSIFASGTSNGLTGPTDAVFRAGMWWDPKLNGSGWEINRGGNNVFGIWYTYQEDGTPIWYLTSGVMEDGRFEHDLLSFTWDYTNNRVSAPKIAGSVSIQFPHSQLAEVNWQLGTQLGKQYLQPFIFATTPTLDDHSGSWSDPTESGYGFTIQTQDDISYAVLYYYDEKGAPAWAAGTKFSDDQAHKLWTANDGACPGCSYRKPSFEAAGELVTSYQSESSMQADLTLIDAVPFWTKTKAQHRMFSRPPSGRPHPAALATIASADALAQYFKAGFEFGYGGPPYGIVMCPPPIVSPAPPPVAAPPDSSISATNVQEQGVDEADVIKVASGYLYSLDYPTRDIPFSEDRTNRDQSITRYKFATQDEAPKGDGNYAVTIPSTLNQYGSGYLSNQGLYHYTNAEPESQKLIYLSTVTEGQCQVRQAASTHVQTFDTGPGADFLADNKFEIDGELIASRTIDDHMFLALVYQPDIYTLTERAFGEEVAQQLQLDGTAAEVLFESVDPEILLPIMKFGGDSTRPLVAPENIMMPPLPVTNIRPVLSILLMFDLNDLNAPPESVAIMGAIDGMYATSHNVYFASSRAAYTLDETGSLSRSGFTDTDIHQLAISAEKFAYLGSGTVEGSIGSDPERLAFRMSENDGHLRVVSSSNRWRERWGELGRHRLTILGEADRNKLLMRPVSVLPNADRPTNIGKPGEDIRAVRFQGKRAYVVTFERVDPLYALDLTYAEDPFILGELEIEGFSSYLHPVGEDLLIGVGMNAVNEITPQGPSLPPITRTWMQGMQVGLFDVSELSSPVLLDLYEIGYRGTSSTLIDTHHAFTSVPGDPEVGEPMRFIIPVTEHAPTDGIVDPDPGHWYPWNNTGIRMFELNENMDGSTSLNLVGSTAIASSDTTATDVEYFYQNSNEEHSRSVIYADQVYYYFRGGLFRTEWSGNTFTPADNCPLCTPAD